jgi:hypothetical protein
MNNQYNRAYTTNLVEIDSIPKPSDKLRHTVVNDMYNRINQAETLTSNYGLRFQIQPLADVELSALQFPANCSSNKLDGELYIEEIRSESGTEHQVVNTNSKVELRERIHAEETKQGIGTQVLVLQQPYLLKKHCLYNITLHSVSDPWFCYSCKPICSYTCGQQSHIASKVNNEIIVYYGAAVYDQYISTYKRNCWAFSGVLVYSVTNVNDVKVAIDTL